ncbi:energy transducer TonB [Bdellovibrio sp. BCCA]|uniref:energy transducer TonB n=1 Tax=Bdellovibrio sp. BCCA TaxID=3136281 RepID=UPI0030F1044D
MKYALWIVVSLILHLALGSYLWFCGHENPHSFHEEILDLTLATSAAQTNAVAPVMTPSVVKKTSVSGPPSFEGKNISETTAQESPAEGANSSESAESTPVGWGEVTRFPKVAKEVKATYPAEAKKAGVDGAVVLDVLIDRSGKVRDVNVISGPGFGLNESAIEALKQFEFQPAQKGSESVAVKIRYTYRFKLDVN